MALLQTLLTAWKTSGQIGHLALGNGQTLTGIITDDGSTGGDDTIKILVGGQPVFVPKAAIANISDPTNIPAAVGTPGQGTNAIKLL